MKKIVIKNFWSPGDVVVSTALVRDIHLRYPRQFITDVRSGYPDLWAHNPYITPLDEKDPAVESFHVSMGQGIGVGHGSFHYLEGMLEAFNQRFGVSLRPTRLAGDIHLSDAEKAIPCPVPTDKPIWLVLNGGKLDHTAKQWDPSRYQEVVDRTNDRITWVQVGQTHSFSPAGFDHVHHDMTGVVDLRGKTTMRELVRLMYHASGVLCHVTLAMHLAAAVPTRSGLPINRACVTLAGGREPLHWEAYPHHQYLHTLGALPCCQNGGCWKSRVLPLPDGDKAKNDSLCHRPTCLASGVTIPKCMDMIMADDVVRAVERYLEFYHA